MRKNKITSEIFKSEDGKVFQSEIELKKYKNKLKEEEKKVTYWQLTHDPDLKNGQGYACLKLAKCYAETAVEEYIRDFCYRTYGRPLAFIQNGTIMKNWTIKQITKEVFDNPDKFYTFYKDLITKIELTVGEKDEGLNSKTIDVKPE